MASTERHLNQPASGGNTTMRGMTCLVTGATSGIGEQTAHGLARLGAAVLIVARDAERGAAVAADIRAAAPWGTVELFVADLAAQADVRQLATDVAERHPRLDVLINNAAAVNAAHRLTSDGIEATLAVNHLAPFLLTHLLLEPLTAAPAARVITVSSYMHHRVKTIPLQDLNGERGYRGQDAYNLTKLMNILFTYELARRCWLEIVRLPAVRSTSDHRRATASPRRSPVCATSRYSIDRRSSAAASRRRRVPRRSTPSSRRAGPSAARCRWLRCRGSTATAARRRARCAGSRAPVESWPG